MATSTASVAVIIVSNMLTMTFLYLLVASHAGFPDDPSSAGHLSRASFRGSGVAPPHDAAAANAALPAVVASSERAAAAAAAAADAVSGRLQTMEAAVQQLTSAVADVQRTSAAAAAPQRSQAVDASAQVVSPPAQGLPPAASAGAAVQRDAVLGMAKGIHLQNLYQFVRSLRQASASVDIVIFIDEVPATHKEVFDAYRVTVVRFSVADLPATIREYHPSSYRWIMMRDWMAKLKLPAPYDRVMFTDVRDTVFQRDPFVNVKEPGFYAFLEAKPGTIRQCGWNSGWVKDCFGPTVLSQIGGNIISCSGTSMATWRHAMQYVQLMATELEGNKCERNGVDQGMHNVFVHRKQLDDLHVITNEDGWIATVQSMKTVHRNAFGDVLNARGDIVAVVHQWDRSSHLKQQYERQYLIVPPHERDRK